MKFYKKKWLKIGISPERTPVEQKNHHSLMTALRQQRDRGEQVCLVGDKIESVINQKCYIYSSQQKNQNKYSTYLLHSPLIVN